MWNFHQSEKKTACDKVRLLSEVLRSVRKKRKKVYQRPTHVYFITLPIRPKKYK